MTAVVRLSTVLFKLVKRRGFIVIGAGTGTTPCMLFMPQIESWSLAKEEVGEDLLEETARSYVLSKVSVPTTVSSSWSVFLQHIKCLSPDTSFMFLVSNLYFQYLEAMFYFSHTLILYVLSSVSFFSIRRHSDLL